MQMNVNCVSDVNFCAAKGRVPIKKLDFVKEAMGKFEAKQFGKPMMEDNLPQKTKHQKIKSFWKKVELYWERHVIFPQM